MLCKLSMCAAFLSLSLWGQTPAASPAFTAADVHVTAKDDNNLSPGTLRGDQYEMRGMTMLTMISRAYAMESDRIYGGPRWLEMDKFDVIAKMPAGTKVDAAPPMLKKLLAERFGDRPPVAFL